MWDIMPLHLLRTGTTFLFPDEGEDSFFKVISKDGDSIAIEHTSRIPDIGEILHLAFIPFLSNILSSDIVDNPYDIEEYYL